MRIISYFSLFQLLIDIHSTTRIMMCTRFIQSVRRYNLYAGAFSLQVKAADGWNIIIVCFCCWKIMPWRNSMNEWSDSPSKTVVLCSPCIITHSHCDDAGGGGARKTKKLCEQFSNVCAIIREESW